MRNDHDIERTIAAGERNKEVSGLIQNWCRHARVEKFGGVGLIEQFTGLPIGHHGMACENASNGGMATWDLADAAVEFYDRNCATCSKRLAVGIPNLLSLVSKRDAHVERVEGDRRKAQQEKTAALLARTQRRKKIRSTQPPFSSGILDLIDDLDDTVDDQACAKLLGIGALAPEAFTTEIIEYCFDLLEKHEKWFVEIGLQLLRNLHADPSRLVRCAMLFLTSHDAVETACEIVQSNVGLIEVNSIASAMPALVWRAEPERSHQIGYSTYVHDPCALVAMYQAHRNAVETAISSALDSRNPYLISAGARAIVVLSQFSNLRASAFARSIIAKLARAHILMDKRETFGSGDDEAIIRLQQALFLALKDAPHSTDELVGNFIASSSSEGEKKILKAYAAVLNPRGQWYKKEDRQHPALRLALRRLINAVSTSKDYEVLRVVQDAFHNVSESATLVARAEMDTLLGSALGLDDRMDSLSTGPLQATGDAAALDRQNMRQILYHLQQTLVEWGARSAAGDARASDAYLDVLRKIPEGRDRMRAVLTGKLHVLMETPAGLGAILPDLYSAMLHPGNLVRSAAIKVIGELDGKRLADLPELLLEAFLMHLSDPYVIVHQSAVETLERINFPEEMKARAGRDIFHLINCYAFDQNGKSFLLTCIRLFLTQFLLDEHNADAIGKYFVSLLERIDSKLLARELRWLSHHLANVKGFAELVINALADEDLSDYDQEHIFSALNRLPANSIRIHSPSLVKIAATQPANFELFHALVEILTRAGAWTDARGICQAVHDNIPDTDEKRPQKLHVRLQLIATQYETSIAEGLIEELPALSQAWKETYLQLERLQFKDETRNNFLPGIPSSDWRG